MYTWFFFLFSKMTIFDSKGKEMQEMFLGVNVPFHTMTLIGDNLIFFKQKRYYCSYFYYYFMKLAGP